MFIAESDRTRPWAGDREDSTIWFFDGATGAEYDLSLDSWKQDLFPLDVPEKFGNRSIDDPQRRSHHFGDEDELGPWWNNPHYPGGQPSSDDSFAVTSSPGTASTGANWTDSDGNGYYNLGDTLVVTGSVFVGAYTGGVGSGGGGSLPPDDTTSIPVPTGETATEIPGQESLPTTCVETTFATEGVSLAAVNRAALAASNAIAGLADHRFEYSSIIFYHEGKVGFTEPHTDRLPGQVDLLGGRHNLPSGAIILAVLHNHPDLTRANDGYPSETDWGAYAQIKSYDFGRGITVDGNFLYYISTDRDGKTRVYDKTDEFETVKSCPLQ